MWQDGCRASKLMRSGRWAWIRALNPRPLRHESAYTNTPVHQNHTRVQIYTNNKLSDVIPLKSRILTPWYPLVLRWHHSSSASFADIISLNSLSSSCQHTQYVHCHDLRNRTTKYHLDMHVLTHTLGTVSRTYTFSKPNTYTLNPNRKTSKLEHSENK
jgi:CHAD domain-containing protein